MAFEIVRLVADDVAVQQALVDHAAVVKAGHSGHKLPVEAACSG